MRAPSRFFHFLSLMNFETYIGIYRILHFESVSVWIEWLHVRDMPSICVCLETEWETSSLLGHTAGSSFAITCWNSLLGDGKRKSLLSCSQPGLVSQSLSTIHCHQSTTDSPFPQVYFCFTTDKVVMDAQCTVIRTTNLAGQKPHSARTTHYSVILRTLDSALDSAVWSSEPSTGCDCTYCDAV